MRRIGWRAALAVVLTLALVAPAPAGPAPTAQAASEACGLEFVEATGSPISASTTGVVAVGRFNGDGYDDLAVGPPGPEQVTILMGNGTGTFSRFVGGPWTAGLASSMVAGRLNGDGYDDLAVGNYLSDTVSILLGNGDGTFARAVGSPIPTGARPFSVAMGDLNGDGVNDLAVSNQGDGTVTILLGNGTGAFTQAPGSPIAVGQFPVSVAMGSLNADGFADLAVANAGSNSVTILLGNGTGTFSQASGSPIAVGSEPRSVAMGRLNGDSLTDLAVVNGRSDSVTILLGNGNGTFNQAAGSPVAVGSSPSSVAVGSFNRDGLADLAVANAGSDSVTILLGNGNGTFSQPSTSPIAVGSFPFSLAVGSFNGDGLDDLVVGNARSDTVTILLPACRLADLGVSMADSPDPASYEADVTYTITARNEGPDAASSVTLSNPLPAATTFVSLAAPAGWSCATPAVGASGSVRCTIPTFLVGSVGSATFTLVVRVGSRGVDGDTIRNTVSISSAVATDPIGTNNSAGSDTALTRTACGPRPSVVTEMVRNGDGRLRVTVSAATNQGLSNTLRALTWTRLDNATVEVVGVGSAAPGERTSLPAGTQSATLLIGRVSPGGGATVHLVVTDACGDWPTFFGGGPSAF